MCWGVVTNVKLLTTTMSDKIILSDQRIQGIVPGQYATIYDSAANLVIAAGQIG